MLLGQNGAPGFGVPQVDPVSQMLQVQLQLLQGLQVSVNNQNAGVEHSWRQSLFLASILSSALTGNDFGTELDACYEKLIRFRERIAQIEQDAQGDPEAKGKGEGDKDDNQDAQTVERERPAEAGRGSSN